MLRPHDYEAACNDLDGADQLYRVHLVLCGGSHGDALLSGVLEEHWQRALHSSVVRELFHTCFGSSAGDRPLVQRFESRPQLSKHLHWHEVHSGADSGRPRFARPEREDEAFEDIRASFDSWVRAVAGQLEGQRAHTDSVTVSASGASSQALGFDGCRQQFAALRARFEHLKPGDAGVALEYAQMLTSAYEILADQPDPDGLGGRLRLTIDRFLDTSLARSRGAVRFEASLLRVRALAVEERFMDARESSRVLRRISHDDLSRGAVELTDAFILERARDYHGANMRYQEVLRLAEQLGADELTARAVLGQLRCDVAAAAGPHRERLLTLRAQTMVQVQAARAPELFYLSPTSTPRLFVSYRSNYSKLTEAITAKFRSPAKEAGERSSSSEIQCWTDHDLKSWEDFSPAIHRELLSCAAMLLILGPEFFESHWCIHELHFALGQHELRGMPVFWLWCGDKSAPDQWPEAIDQWRARKTAEGKQPEYYRFHLEDRLQRIVRSGICLSQSILRIEPGASFPQLDDVLQPVRDTLDRLRATGALSQHR
jgi:hypothetical protein